MDSIKRLAWVLGTAALVLGCATAPPAPAADAADPHLWLEDVTGDAALAWVRQRNAASESLLGQQPGFAVLRGELRAALEARDRIPSIERIGAHVYNFWTDAAHQRGLWRRTTLESYGSTQPAWETVLDLDALGANEGQSWVWGGATCLRTAATGAPQRCMIALSRGGADAKVLREFDLQRKAFVESGFALPEAKSSARWVDADTLYVATHSGAGSMTDSGYPRSVKRWKRGTPLAAAETVFEVQPRDVGAGVEVDATAGFERHLFTRVIDFHTVEQWLLRDGTLVKLDVPADALVFTHREWLLLQLRSSYSVAGVTHPAGALLAVRLDDHLRGARNFHVLFSPVPTRNLERSGVRFTQSRVLLLLADNVATRVEERWVEGGQWRSRAVAAPGTGRGSVRPLHDPARADDPLGEQYLLGYEDFLTPESLFLARTGSDERRLLKTRAPLFDARGMRVEQLHATSRDGTRVPYFVVWPAGASATGDNPTLLYGYGGFQVSLNPGYFASTGTAWMARGGVYVHANIRGGGEFGPPWHQAALKGNRQRAFDDFIAVAEDLAARRITSPRHLGIMGGSNGGLLVGAVLTQRPDLFHAAISKVPLLDMRRFHKLLAGASWMAEYGNPDQPDDWAYLSRYSPYHQVKPGVAYPLALFTTSTRDDRVHPGHARKMVARMQEQGHPVLYYENIEGGHGGAADAQQRAHLLALEFSYLWMRLGPPPAAGTASTSPASPPGTRR